MALSSLIPALIADRHENCFVIGLGTGVSAGELAALDETRKVTVAEISIAVIAANPLFESGNLGVWKSPKVEIVRGDAYRALLRSDDRYDVILSEPSNPWVSGVEMLYSREFLEAARDRLAPGGVYGQWFHLYETNPKIVALVLRTYVSVFPYVSVWFTGGMDLLLLGIDGSERALDVAALEARFDRPDFAEGFARVEIDHFSQLLAHELIPLGTLHAEKLVGPIQTLRQPILSDWAARSFFKGGKSRLAPHSSDRHQEVAIRNSLLHRYAADDEILSEEIFDAATHETCRFKRFENCATYLARWSLDHPDSERRRDALAGLRELGLKQVPNLSGELHALYDVQLPGIPRSLTSLDLRRLTGRFIDYYVHPVPFDREALASIWERCRGAGCDEARTYLAGFFWDDQGP
jgi:SAM-dependent methyltransferase